MLGKIDGEKGWKIKGKRGRADGGTAGCLLDTIYKASVGKSRQSFSRLFHIYYHLQVSFSFGSVFGFQFSVFLFDAS